MTDTKSKIRKEIKNSCLSRKDNSPCGKKSFLNSNPISRRAPINLKNMVGEGMIKTAVFLFGMLLIFGALASAIPAIIINSPISGYMQDRNPLLDVSAVGADSIWYSLDSGANITIGVYDDSVSQNISLIANGGFETAVTENGSLVPLHWQFYDSTTLIEWNSDSYALTSDTLFGDNALEFTYDGNDSNDYLLYSMFVGTGKKNFDVEFYVKPDMTFNNGSSIYGYCLAFYSSDDDAVEGFLDKFYMCFNNTDAWSFDDWATESITEYLRTDAGDGWFKINFTTPDISVDAAYIDIALMPAYDDNTYTGTVLIDEISILLDYGTYMLDVWANDTEGISHQSRIFTILENIPISIVLVEPENNSVVANGTIIKVNATTDSVIDSCILSVGGGENETMSTVAGGVFEHALYFNADGIYAVKVYCNDTDGGRGFEEYSFDADVTAPVVQLFSPEEKTYLSNLIPLNYAVSEENVICTYSLNDTETVALLGNTTLLAGDGLNSLVLSCVDEAGNTGNTTRTFTVEYPEETYFQNSQNITTGNPFLMAYKVTLNNTDDKNMTINLWGLYDTNGDDELGDEYVIQSNLSLAITLDDSSYPAKLFFEVPEFNENEHSIFITWNATIEPVNFDLNRWVEPISDTDGSWTFSAEREYAFILPTNFSMNYTNVRVVWPYVSDGDILEVSANMPFFEITSRGIEATFEKVVGAHGYFLGKGEHNGITNFNGAFIHFSNTTTRIIADLPFVKYAPKGFEMQEPDMEISSVIFDSSVNKATNYNFYSYGQLEGEPSRWTVTDNVSKQYRIPFTIEGLHISTGTGAFDAISPSNYWANVGWDNTETQIDADSFTHTAYKHVQNITADLKRTIIVKGAETILSYELTNIDMVSKNYDVWLVDFVYMLKNDDLNKQYAFYENSNTTKELMHHQEKTRCIGLAEEQVHQSALYCPIQPYTTYLKNTDMADESFLLPPEINDSFELVYADYGSIIPSTVFEFNTGSVGSGSSAKISMHVFTSVLSEAEADSETFDEAILRMNQNLIEKVYLDDSGSAEVIYGADELLEKIDVEVISSSISEDLRTVNIKNSDVFDYIVDETELNTEPHRVISTVSYNGGVLETNKYVYNNVSGTLVLFDLTATFGTNSLEINYLPFEPQWSNRGVSPLSPTEWVQDKEYVFSIDWIDDFGIDSVVFKLDGVDYTDSNRSNITYEYRLVDLACGEYKYVWWANDTDGNIVETPEKKYKITGGDCDVAVDDVPEENTNTPSTLFLEIPEDTEDSNDGTNIVENIPEDENEQPDAIRDLNETQETNTNNNLDKVEDKKGFFDYIASIGSVLASLLALAGTGLLVTNKNVQEHVKRRIPKRRNIQLAQSIRTQQLRKIKENIRSKKK